MTKVVKMRSVMLGDGNPKIAVSISGQDEEKLRSSLWEVLKVPPEYLPDIIELRMDGFLAYSEAEQVTATLRSLRKENREIPYLFTWRNAREGGRMSLSQPEYCRLLQCVAESGCVDAIDVEAFFLPESEEFIKELKKLRIPVIASYHDTAKTPENMRELLLKLYNKQADMVKLAVMANTSEDVRRFVRTSRWFSENYEVPLISMAMGEYGQYTRIHLKETGSALTFGAVGRPSAPGQLPLEELVEKIRFAEEKKYE